MRTPASSLALGSSPDRSRRLVLIALAVLVSAAFSLVPASAFARLGGYSSSVIGPSANGPVYDIVIAPDGTTYLGGAFTTLGGVACGRIAKVDAAGNVSAMPGANIAGGDITCMTIDGTILYVGGGFSSVGGQPRGRVASIDLLTGNVTSWNPGANGMVSRIAVARGSVFIGGSFTTAGGQSRVNVANINAAGNATSWNPGANGPVYAFAEGPDRLYVCGDFTTIGGQSRNRLAAFSFEDGLVDPGFNPGANGMVWDLLLDGQTLYAVGWFTTCGGQSRNYAAALDASSGVPTAWNPLPDGAVHAIGISGEHVYLGGFFMSIGGAPAAHMGSVTRGTGAFEGWSPQASDNVYCLDLNDDALWAGGNVISWNGVMRPYVGAFEYCPVILPSAGPGGSISPDTTMTLSPPLDVAVFDITPDTGYHVEDVLVDGVSVGATETLVLRGVTRDHTVHAEFAINTYEIAPSAGPGGSISPSTTQTVEHGSSATFTVAPDPGYCISDVLVDGVSQGCIASYTFNGVDASHTISATFDDYHLLGAPSPSVIPFGRMNTLFVHLTAGATEVEGLTGIQVWKRTLHTAGWSLLGPAVWDASEAAYTATDSPRYNCEYQFRFAGDGTYPAATSTPVYGWVQAGMSAPWTSPWYPEAGLNDYVYGELRPYHSGTTRVYLYRKVGGAWRYWGLKYASNFAARSASGEYFTRYRFRWVPPSRGAWKMYAVHNDSLHSNTRSPVRYFTVK